MGTGYTLGGDTWQRIGWDKFAGQTFRVPSSVTLFYLKLYLAKPDPRWAIFALIYSADIDGLPTGDPLTKATFQAKDFPDGESQAWITATLTSPLPAEPTDYFVIVVYGTEPFRDNYDWAYDAGDADYPTGHRLQSDDKGVNWTHHPDDDHLFYIWGTPWAPPPPPTPKPPRFALMTITQSVDVGGYHITAYTDSPCHLYLKWTDSEPLTHRASTIQRGLPHTWESYWCFVSWHTIEQDELGDTEIHTFFLPFEFACQTKWFTFSATEGDLTAPTPSLIFPPWEPWGATLTQNHPWEQAFTPDDISHSLAAGILRLYNPPSPKSGIRAIIPHGTMPLVDTNGHHLHFAAKATAATINNPTDWIAYHLLTTHEAEQLHLEYVAARGDAWGAFGSVHFAGDNTAVIDYGMNPGVVDTLELWQWGRRQLGKSDDPTDWDCFLAYIILERQAPPTNIDIHNDYFNLLYLPQGLTSPSGAPIFKKHYQVSDYSDGPNNIGASINKYYARCQSFQPLFAYTLKAILVKLRREGNPLPLEVKIYRSTPEGIPIGTPIYQTEVDPDTIETSGAYPWHTIPIAQLPLAAGNYYTFMLTNLSSWPGNNIYVTENITDPAWEYPRGHEITYYPQLGIYIPSTIVDMNFKLLN